MRPPVVQHAIHNTMDANQEVKFFTDWLIIQARYPQVCILKTRQDGLDSSEAVVRIIYNVINNSLRHINFHKFDFTYSKISLQKVKLLFVLFWFRILRTRWLFFKVADKPIIYCRWYPTIMSVIVSVVPEFDKSYVRVIYIIYRKTWQNV